MHEKFAFMKAIVVFAPKVPCLKVTSIYLQMMYVLAPQEAKNPFSVPTMEISSAVNSDRSGLHTLLESQILKRSCIYSVKGE